MTVGPSAALETRLPAPICIERLINSGGGDTFRAPDSCSLKNKTNKNKKIHSCASLFLPPPPLRAALGQRRQNTVQRVTLAAAVRFRCARRNSAVINSAKPQENLRLSLGGRTLLCCPRGLAVRPQSGENQRRFFFWRGGGILSSSNRGRSLFAVTSFLAAASAFLIRHDFLGRNASESRNLS